jgi:glycosyltransferase involved in cell wall biosynthesis
MHDIVIIGSFPKLQRVKQYDSLAETDLSFVVWYMRRMPYGRIWKEEFHINHEHMFLEELRIYKHLYVNKGLIKALQSSRPRAFVMSQYGSFSSQVIVWYARTRKIPVYLWAERPGLNDFLYKGYKKAVVRYLRRFLLLSFDTRENYVIPVGPLARKSYSNHFNKATILSPFGLPLDLSNYTKTLKDGSFHPLRCIFLADLTLRKGIDVVIDSFLHLTSLGIADIEFHVYGKGPLLYKVAEISKAHSNFLYHGFIELSQVPEAYKLADISLCPVRHDGWGNNITESLASGVPVISSRNSDAACSLINDSNGILLHNNTYLDLSKAILKYLNNKSLLSSHIEEAISSVQELDLKLSSLKFREYFTGV